MHAKGIHEHARPDAPSFDPAKQDITRLSMREVGRMLQYYTEMLAFATFEAAKTDQDEEVAEHKYRSVYNVELLKKSGGQQKYLLEAELSVDPTIRRLKSELLEAKAKNALTKAVVDGLKAKTELASREISRRQVEFELGGRNASR